MYAAFHASLSVKAASIQNCSSILVCPSMPYMLHIIVCNVCGMSCVSILVIFWLQRRPADKLKKHSSNSKNNFEPSPMCLIVMLTLLDRCNWRWQLILTVGLIQDRAEETRPRKTIVKCSLWVHVVLKVLSTWCDVSPVIMLVLTRMTLQTWPRQSRAIMSDYLTGDFHRSRQLHAPFLSYSMRAYFITINIDVGCGLHIIFRLRIRRKAMHIEMLRFAWSLLRLWPPPFV